MVSALVHDQLQVIETEDKQSNVLTSSPTHLLLIEFREGASPLIPASFEGKSCALHVRAVHYLR